MEVNLSDYGVKMGMKLDYVDPQDHLHCCGPGRIVVSEVQRE